MPKDGVGKVALISRRLKNHALERQCSGHGMCRDDGTDAVCVCDSGFTDKDVPCLIAQKVAQVTVYAIETHCNVPVIQVYGRSM